MIPIVGLPLPLALIDPLVGMALVDILTLPLLGMTPVQTLMLAFDQGELQSLALFHCTTYSLRIPVET